MKVIAKNLLSKGFLATFLATALLLLQIDLRNSPDFVTYIAYIFAIISLLLSYFSAASFSAAVVLVCVVIPFFSQSALLLSVVAIVAGSAAKKVEKTEIVDRDLFVLTAIAALFILGLSRSVSFELDSDHFKTFLLDNQDLYGYLSYVEFTNRALYQSIIHCAGIVLMVLLAGQVALRRNDPLFYEGLFWAVVAASCVASVVLFFQFFGTYSFLTLNQTAFWSFSERYPATFTDPNAFGISAALLAFIAAVIYGDVSTILKKRVLVGAISILLIAALWSGSRTLLLALAIAAGYFCWHRFRVSKRSRLPLAVLFSLLLLLPIPTINSSLQSVVSAPSIVRVLRSINGSTVSQMFESRQIYGRLALEVWRDSPVFGVGLGRFYPKQQEAALSLGIDLQNWRDNANNFYLQTLSEQGIVGFLILLLSGFLLLRKRKATIASKSRTALLFFAILLLTGPHLFFAEVKFLAAVLIGLTIERTESTTRVFKSLLMALILIAMTGLFAAKDKDSSDSGLYGLEGNKPNQYRWTSAAGRINFDDDKIIPETFRFKVERPEDGYYPIAVALIVLGQGGEEIARRDIITEDSSWQNLDLTQFASDKLSKLEFKVSSTWKPAGETRYLGMIIAEQ